VFWIIVLVSALLKTAFALMQNELYRLRKSKLGTVTVKRSALIVVKGRLSEEIE
jgi:hypothetical protein